MFNLLNTQESAVSSEYTEYSEEEMEEFYEDYDVSCGAYMYMVHTCT